MNYSNSETRLDRRKKGAEKEGNAEPMVLSRERGPGGIHLCWRPAKAVAQGRTRRGFVVLTAAIAFILSAVCSEAQQKETGDPGTPSIGMKYPSEAAEPVSINDHDRQKLAKLSMEENPLAEMPGQVDIQVQAVLKPGALTSLLLGFGVLVACWRSGGELRNNQVDLL